jgi:UDP-glucuronate 4-epimerase
VIGVDNLNDYYDVRLKEDRLAQLGAFERFTFHRGDISRYGDLAAAFSPPPDYVVNLAAQVGVRHSVKVPLAFVESNLVGFANVLEHCRLAQVKHLVYASSSSVYGGNRKLPFSVQDNVDHPMSLYAATKKANELMAHSYSSLYGLPTTGLRFFTVYGPWGRPDMAVYSFTRAIATGQPIKVYNQGHMVRDFTYVDDIVEGLARVIERPASPAPDWDGRHPDPATSWVPYRVHNIGNQEPVLLVRFIEILEGLLGKTARQEFLPMQPGDVEATFADVASLEQAVDFHPHTPIEEGLRRFVEWFLEYHRQDLLTEARG